jgi:hypothetical protein
MGLEQKSVVSYQTERRHQGTGDFEPISQIRKILNGRAMSTTTEKLQHFASAVEDILKESQSGTPGFEWGSSAKMIGLAAERLAEEFDHERAFELVMLIAKHTVGFRTAVEGGTLDDATANERIEQTIEQVAAHLGTGK